MNDRFLQTQKLYQVVDLESYLFLIFLGLVTYLFYKFLLKNVNQERHQNIREQFKSLTQYYASLSILFGLYLALSQTSEVSFKALLPYLAFISFLLGVLCFIRTCHLMVLQYLFLSSMKSGVPLLIVNIFSLLLSIVVIIWTVNNIFGVQLAPLIATSAAFTVILGLALQDTLGNLFAGISLQIDSTFEIGNWLEIMNGNSKIVGQVKELSWRSTVLIGFSDELIVLPNKLVASSQISNFSPESGPILRSQTFKFPHDFNISLTLKTLEDSLTEASFVLKNPKPLAFVLETNENSIAVKLIYFIDNYGQQYLIGDQVISKALAALSKNNISVAKPILHVTQSTELT